MQEVNSHSPYKNTIKSWICSYRCSHWPYRPNNGQTALSTAHTAPGMGTHRSIESSQPPLCPGLHLTSRFSRSFLVYPGTQGLLVPCCVVPPTESRVEVTHEGQALWTWVCSCLSIKGLIHPIFQVGRPEAELNCNITSLPSLYPDPKALGQLLLHPQVELQALQLVTDIDTPSLPPLLVLAKSLYPSMPPLQPQEPSHHVSSILFPGSHHICGTSTRTAIWN